MITPHSVLERFPPLHARKSPGLSVLIGVLTGGIGLAIYFRSLRDLFPVEVAVGLVIVVSLATGADPLQLSSIVAPVIGGLYGYARATDSNRRRAEFAPVVVGTLGAR